MLINLLHIFVVGFIKQNFNCKNLQILMSYPAYNTDILAPNNGLSQHLDLSFVHNAFYIELK